MSISDVTENNILGLYFQAVAIANIADNAGTAPETNIAVALMTADPTDAGTMQSSEAAYTGYARASVARSAGGWSLGAGSISPQASIDFPAGTGGGETVTHFAVGKTGGGAADIYWSGTVSPNIATGDGVTPQLTTSTTITLD